MKYVISDIHGYYGRYRMMLERINFGDSDELYILGDCIDRGPEGIKVLQDVMSRKNVHMIMGNHEHLFMCYLKKVPYYCSPYNERSMQELIFMNGAAPTLMQYDELNDSEKNEIINFISNLPYEIEIDIEDKHYRLVHGYPADKSLFGDTENIQYKDQLIWERPIKGFTDALPDNNFVIVGHTPTPEYTKTKPFPIVEIAPRFYDIDCGMASSKTHFRQLGCLRLEDMREFYV